jgi:membrane protein DedA with SNARE-associated domain
MIVALAAMVVIGMLAGYWLGYAHGHENGIEDTYQAIDRHYQSRKAHRS